MGDSSVQTLTWHLRTESVLFIFEAKPNFINTDFNPINIEGDYGSSIFLAFFKRKHKHTHIHGMFIFLYHACELSAPDAGNSTMTTRVRKYIAFHQTQDFHLPVMTLMKRLHVLLSQLLGKSCHKWKWSESVIIWFKPNECHIVEGTKNISEHVSGNQTLVLILNSLYI